MRRVMYGLSLAMMFAGAAVILSAQGPPQTPKGWVHVPASTLERLAELGVFAHTNHLIHVEPQATGLVPTGQSPQSLWSYYVGSGSPNGGTHAIAIVDAYHYPSALGDFNVFAGQFGLPVETSTDALNANNTVFQVVYASGTQPPGNCGWAQEAALDIEWAHAMAPGAKIILVEAASNSFADLFLAVDRATTLVRAAGGGEVSMSWGGSEFSTESAYDSHFPTGVGVVYFASSGDSGGKTIYPSVSPKVVAAGGTTLVLSGGTITGEKGWSGSGGGPSKFEPMPQFQTVVQMPARIGNHRGSPDISFDADPYTGVSVYDSTVCQGMSGWMVFGGTSVSAPALAGLANTAGPMSDSAALLIQAYTLVGNPAVYNDFHDVKSGRAGSYKAGIGWDYVTGLGTPKGLGGM